jgi:two-component system, OmpR family, sensor kinase
MRLFGVRSLRARLLVFLLAAVIGAALIQGMFAYRSALREADAIFDYHMQQMALSLRAGTPLSGPVLPGGDDREFEFLIQIWTVNGERVFESAPDARLPQVAVLGFSDARAGGTTYRVFTLQMPAQIIQIAQDLSVRKQMATAFAFSTIVPVALFAPMLVLIVWWVVTRSLTPVTRTRALVAARAADDPAPLPADDLPDEIRPLVAEINLLFTRVRAAFDTQKQFVADAAHELRSPLTALKLQVQTLQRAPDDHTRRVAIERLAAGIERAARLVEQLLVLARQESDAPFTPQTVPLAALTQSVIGDLLPMAQARGIDLGVVRTDAGAVDGDPDALRVLLRNLIDNAIKYAPEHGRVDVAVQSDANTLLLIVDDNGPGIAPADRARVFDRFYRAPDAAALGNGLGLAIVKTIAERHGASIVLEQAPTLGGLRVCIRLHRRATA